MTANRLVEHLMVLSWICENLTVFFSRQGGCHVKTLVFLDFLGSICSPTKGVEQKTLAEMARFLFRVHDHL